MPELREPLSEVSELTRHRLDASLPTYGCNISNLSLVCPGPAPVIASPGLPLAAGLVLDSDWSRAAEIPSARRDEWSNEA